MFKLTPFLLVIEASGKRMAPLNSLNKERRGREGEEVRKHKEKVTLN